MDRSSRAGQVRLAEGVVALAIHLRVPDSAHVKAAHGDFFRDPRTRLRGRGNLPAPFRPRSFPAVKAFRFDGEAVLVRTGDEFAYPVGQRESADFLEERGLFSSGASAPDPLLIAIANMV